MAKKKKKKSNTPRHKRLNRQGRLEAAKHWIPKKLVHGYSNHFGVNKLNAVQELEMLGYTIEEIYKQKLRENEMQKQRDAEKRKETKKKKLELEEEFPYSNENFAFIAGETSGGAPFGITWEEWFGEAEENIDNIGNKKESAKTTTVNYNDDELPF